FELALRAVLAADMSGQPVAVILFSFLDVFFVATHDQNTKQIPPHLFSQTFDLLLTLIIYQHSFPYV
ncbi:MAG: hypothetical protein MI799_15820, partial [Desulfobacterales bacterium]|nr:hypothetical protein [Desulfobacterales bacterium]